MKRTIMEVFTENADKYGDRVALKFKIDGQWKETTWRDYHKQVRVTARAFMALGLEKGKAVSILGNNCPQWFVSDLAGVFAVQCLAAYTQRIVPINAGISRLIAKQI